MNIEKIFKNLSINKELILYLFEYRNKSVYISEIEEKFYKDNTFEILEALEIIELYDDKITLDERINNFIEEYIDGSGAIEISTISDIIKELNHKIDILREFRDKQKSVIPQIRRSLKKCNFLLFQNLDNLRIHIERVYKSADEFSLKLKELNFYKDSLKDFEIALNQFDKFLQLHYNSLRFFYDDDLNFILENSILNKIALNKSLIPLTQDVIEYINQVKTKNNFIEKIVKLKEIKDNFELKQKTNIVNHLDKFDLLKKSIKISANLDSDIRLTEDFASLIQEISVKANLKSKPAPKIHFFDNIKEGKLLNINELHNQFASSTLSLIEFLLQNNKLKDKAIDEISDVYCQMILNFEYLYNISHDYYYYKNRTFKKVYYDNKFR